MRKSVVLPPVNELELMEMINRLTAKGRDNLTSEELEFLNTAMLALKSPGNKAGMGVRMSGD
jgi:hypothetical protein